VSQMSALASEASPSPERVGWGFIVLYTPAYLSTSLLFLAPVLVSLALKVNSLVGIERAPNSLALVAGVGALLAMFSNPFFGMLSDRTSSRFGMRRTWMVIGLAAGSLGILIVALAPNVAVMLVGWCIAQVFFNALLAAEAAVLADHVPASQRGTVAGVLGVCVPLASVGGVALVNLVSGSQIAMFLAPCMVGGFFILLFAFVLKDRRLGVKESSSLP
jgi:MFS family permease